MRAEMRIADHLKNYFYTWRHKSNSVIAVLLYTGSRVFDRVLRRRNRRAIYSMVLDCCAILS
jgi:hypothetical protein